MIPTKHIPLGRRKWCFASLDFEVRQIVPSIALTGGAGAEGREGGNQPYLTPVGGVSETRYGDLAQICKKTGSYQLGIY